MSVDIAKTICQVLGQEKMPHNKITYLFPLPQMYGISGERTRSHVMPTIGICKLVSHRAA